MTNLFPGMFEDKYLKTFSESIETLATAHTIQDIEQAVIAGFAALENVSDPAVRERTKQRLRMMEEQARIRIGSAK